VSKKTADKENQAVGKAVGKVKVQQETVILISSN
jgi:hypothetical protein